MTQSSPLARVNPLHGSDWDSMASRNRGATVFHTSAWARVLYDTYRYRPHYLAAESASGETAGLCLFEVNSWITGRRAVSLPFTDECGPLVTEEHSFDELLGQARSIGQERRWKTLEIRAAPDFLPESAHSIAFYNHRLDLGRGVEGTAAGLDPSVRRAIRKAEKSGVQVTIERSFDAVRRYYELHCLTRHKHGLPPQPFLFFQNIHRHLIHPGGGFIALANLGSKAVAGAVFFLHEEGALYKFGGSDPSADSFRPNNLVMWKGIEHCIQLGKKSLDFGRTSCSNDGLRRYKLQWGSRESLIHYLKWSFSEGHYLREKDRASGLQNRIFRSCPSPLARLLGTLIYPHIA